MNLQVQTFRTAAPVAALLAIAGTADGAVLTAGPGGTYPTVQAALNAAVALPGDDEVRVREGVYPENLSIDLGGLGDLIELSGGWNSSFTTASGARNTVIDGGGLGRVFEILTRGADRLVVHGMQFVNGEAEFRVGVTIDAQDGSSVALYNLTIRDNVAIADRASDAGLYASLSGSADLQVLDCDLLSNTVTSTGTVDARGGGLSVQLSNTSTVSIVGNRIRNNVVSIGPGGFGLGGGADIVQFDPTTTVLLTDNEFRENRITASDAFGTGLLLGGGNWMLRRNLFANNIDDDATAFGAQASLSAYGVSGAGIVSDTLVVNGNARGLQLNAGDDSILRANNLTIVGHPSERGLLANINGTGQLSVYNSISVNNGTNAQLGAGVTEGSNLFVDDPDLFIDPLVGDYRLATGAAAIDAGDDLPPGGLGPLDFAGEARIFGPAVDIGAYEANDVMFRDGFEV
ncbi:hypothetical protein HFP89_06120 [Wenzhouxiangella sp. XN79A]|uniref:choice-of-anchor Q domain-containing protein n=1 Tax=Wenzhouxiangella sp. XN79A TaxID=2724193 RepID=UPI00144AB978|nr:choice-of-anchor Q domain-containing protein [Wenzhouxiangella sp. XN79A]NKI34737.1 hypothetical protein [Wenzhouxiangella sp. XN79A]